MKLDHARPAFLVVLDQAALAPRHRKLIGGIRNLLQLRSLRYRVRIEELALIVGFHWAKG